MKESLITRSTCLFLYLLPTQVPVCEGVSDDEEYLSFFVPTFHTGSCRKESLMTKSPCLFMYLLPTQGPVGEGVPDDEEYLSLYVPAFHTGSCR